MKQLTGDYRHGQWQLRQSFLPVSVSVSIWIWARYKVSAAAAAAAAAAATSAAAGNETGPLQTIIQMR